jgi:hydroxyethylthiazole kinase-like uncharacterized protein yjeF
MKTITKEQMADLDRVMIKEIGIDVPIMMENAALAVALETVELSKKKKAKVLVLSGHGNNGGDALAAARHLVNWGHSVLVVCASSKSKFRPNPLKQLKIIEKMKIPIKYSGKDINFSKYDVIVDGLLGYNLKGNPRGKFAELIETANNSKVQILAIDLPSGLDANTGEIYDPCIKAKTTVALSVAKKGLVVKKAKSYVGKLVVAYMSVPDVVYRKFGVK